jgi:4-amino-4-deoxy-L-arabinose transferase-like glycosyltransferase
MRTSGRPGESLLVWAFATVGSLAFLLAGPYSNYGAAGLLDPWFYTGYFTNFSYLVRQFGPTYFVSRLPWILPGVAAFRVAPPEVASVMLNLAIVAVSAVSLYWAVRWHYGRPAGIAAAVMLAANPYFMSTVGWDYPDGPAIAYALAGLAFAVRPHGARLKNIAICGVLLALSGLTNMSGGPMILGVVAIALLHRRSTPREVIRECCYLAAGAAAVTLALCPVSQLLFGRWTYFYWQVYQTIQTFGNHGFLDKMWGSGGGFLLTAYRLFAPALLLFIGPVVILLAPALMLTIRPEVIARAGLGRLARAAYSGLAVCVTLYAFEDFVLHGAALRVPYHSSYMLAPLFFLAGVLIGECGVSRAAAGLAAAVALILPWLKFPRSWLLLEVCGVVLLAAFLLRRMHAVILAVVLFLSPAMDQTCSAAWDVRNVDTFRHLMSLQSALKPQIDPVRRVRFWFDRDEPPFAFYNSASSLYLWMQADFTRDLPSWPDSELRKQLPPNATLVHLTLHPERLPSREQLLATRGVRVANERRWSMDYGGQTLHVILQDVIE